MNTQPAKLLWLEDLALHDGFPDPETAQREPNGLLAAIGDLSPERLIEAYRCGVFPWYSVGQPILWWSPDPRFVLFPDALRVSRSLRKTIKKHPFELTVDRAFADVVSGCAMPRQSDSGTWITRAMHEAYCRLHALGVAHSVEAWQGGRLVGGFYGVAIGKVFFGESMFSRVNDASKVAFVAFVEQLQRWGYELIDSQLYTDHLARFGAENIPRAEYLALLKSALNAPLHHEWKFDEPGR